MGHKSNPKILRIGINKTWPSRWFASGKKYIVNLQEDTKLRRFVMRELREAGVDKVEIERGADKVSINIFTAKPGVIIGRGGAGIEELKKKIHTKFLKRFRPQNVHVNVTEVDRPHLSAQIVAQGMILELEKRVPFRKVMKQAMGKVERAGALGVKVAVGGRLNGAEIARTEVLTSGKIPLHTLRSDIDYARGAAETTYGLIGVKVWVYKGEIFKKNNNQ